LLPGSTADADVGTWPEESSSTTPSSSPTPPPIINGIPAPACNTDGIDFGRTPAAQAIESFCSNKGYWNTFIVPSISFGSGKTSAGNSKAPGIGDKYDLGDSTDLWLGLFFTNTGHCQGRFEFGIGATDQDKIDHCKLRFGTVLDSCQTDTIANKKGGALQDSCAVYDVTSRKDSSGDPFDGWIANKGTFMCESTDTSAIGGDNSPLKGTCTCWYSGYPGLIDVFKMPPSNSCKDTKPGDLLDD
jgi:hypothetical protein